MLERVMTGAATPQPSLTLSEVDAAFLAVYRVVLLSLASVVGWIDRYLVDGVVNVASAMTVGAGDRLRHIQTGRVQDYFYGVTLGLLMLLVWIGWSL